jgi:hypothetical protein
MLACFSFVFASHGIYYTHHHERDPYEVLSSSGAFLLEGRHLRVCTCSEYTVVITMKKTLMQIRLHRGLFLFIILSAFLGRASRRVSSVASRNNLLIESKGRKEKDMFGGQIQIPKHPSIFFL